MFFVIIKKYTHFCHSMQVIIVTNKLSIRDIDSANYLTTPPGKFFQHGTKIIFLPL